DFGAYLRDPAGVPVEELGNALGAPDLVATPGTVVAGVRVLYRVVGSVDALAERGVDQVRVRARVERCLDEVVHELVLALAVDLHEVRADAEALAVRLRLDEAAGGDLVVHVARRVTRHFRHEHTRLVIPSVRPGTVRIRKAL